MVEPRLFALPGMEEVPLPRSVWEPYQSGEEHPMDSGHAILSVAGMLREDPRPGEHLLVLPCGSRVIVSGDTGDILAQG